jgi:hypothetical protein
MTERMTEILTGVGDVYAGDQLLRHTTYRLEISSALAATPGGGAPTVVEGTIDITGMGEAVVLAGAQQLTLRLEDGRTLQFRLLSSAGRIQVLGGLQPSHRAN